MQKFFENYGELFLKARIKENVLNRQSPIYFRKFYKENVTRISRNIARLEGKGEADHSFSNCSSIDEVVETTLLHYKRKNAIEKHHISSMWFLSSKTKKLWLKAIISEYIVTHGLSFNLFKKQTHYWISIFYPMPDDLDKVVIEI